MLQHGLWVMIFVLQGWVLWLLACELRWPYAFPRWTQGWAMILVSKIAITGYLTVSFLSPHLLVTPTGTLLALGTIVVNSLFLGLGLYRLSQVFHVALPSMALPLPTIVIDEYSVITGWDLHAEQLFGWSAAEALGQTLMHTIMPPADWEAHRAGMARFLANTLPTDPRVPRTLVVQARRKNASVIPVEICVTAVPMDGGGWQFQGVVQRLVAF